MMAVATELRRRHRTALKYIKNTLAQILVDNLATSAARPFNQSWWIEGSRSREKSITFLDRKTAANCLHPLFVGCKGEGRRATGWGVTNFLRLWRDVGDLIYLITGSSVIVVEESMKNEGRHSWVMLLIGYHSFPAVILRFSRRR